MRYGNELSPFFSPKDALDKSCRYIATLYSTICFSPSQKLGRSLHCLVEGVPLRTDAGRGASRGDRDATVERGDASGFAEEVGETWRSHHPAANRVSTPQLAINGYRKWGWDL